MYRTVLGDLFEQPFQEIWNGKRYQELRRDLVTRRPERQAACRGCDMPYDGAKFAVRNMAKTALHRLQLFERRE